jgi:hypothetical protein
MTVSKLPRNDSAVNAFGVALKRFLPFKAGQSTEKHEQYPLKVRAPTHVTFHNVVSLPHNSPQKQGNLATV